MACPILWQNPDRTVTVIDIPRSIAAAQSTHGYQCRRQILSSKALQSPFPNNEPKSASAKAKLKDNTVNAELHSNYRTLIQRALDDVRELHVGDWCLPRHFVEESSREAKKRKLDHSEEDKARDIGTVVNLAISGLSDSRRTMLHRSPLPELNPKDLFCGSTPVTVGIGAGPAHFEYSERHFFSNPTHETISLNIAPSSGEECYAFHIPPRSSCYVDDCANSRSFHTIIRNQAQEMDTRKKFDLIILDPPWPNRSVRRTHKTVQSTYFTSPSLWHIRKLLLNMDLDVVMADHCLVGIWITNKPAVRELVLGQDGIFACWGVELVEEWILLKTTVRGYPVTSVDALWRKPYEVLLLGRKQRPKAGVMLAPKKTAIEDQEIVRRVIISVPDLHSRKPCLKELIEPLISTTPDYRALEIFARHLVSGWWSWGDECIKFNWEKYWQEPYDDKNAY